MGWFQRTYDWIAKWDYPKSIKPWIQALNDLMIAVLQKAGQEYLAFIEQKVIEASKLDVSNADKFKYVFDAARASSVPFIISLKDSELNCIIEFIVSLLKTKGVIT